MKGSCLCGEVQYEVDTLSSPIMHCSCKTCRKAHSAAFNTCAAVKPEDFRWLKGEDKLSQFESSPGKLRKFCSVCGSQLISTKEGMPVHVLRVASLDDDPQQTPAFRIWKSDEVSWLGYEHDMPQYEEWHPNR
ncbi:GFA family protein [Enterovibrio makurazakiensis]|uniref:GFA family protein n=1 Tax=Enterovibrio gelatinilyticus TaxID=2899819 RepID=A0ABT5R4P8_9GAMM|nr:GFA family protein [Enterovibrio sp. ZSDZ42]MDD1794487.1 GFA family protein [Enterovibrio sp. ZSDZ42]